MKRFRLLIYCLLVLVTVILVLNNLVDNQVKTRDTDKVVEQEDKKGD